MDPKQKKKKKKKKGDSWGVDKPSKNPWDIDIDTKDEPKVATGIPLIKPRSAADASEARKMRRKG